MKISRVRDKKTLRPITTRDCENGYQGEFVCITEGCNAQMTFVRKHEQRRFDKVIEVQSFFKLKPHKTHSYENCPYNTLGAVDIIARTSGNDVLKALEKDKYEFSLQVLHKPETDQAGLTTVGTNHPESRGVLPKGKNIISKGTAINYINALTQILTLRAKIDDDKELASIITLMYGGKKINWNQFYFEQDQYMDAYQRVCKLKVQHPICVHGVVWRIEGPTEKFKYLKIKLHSPYVEQNNEITPVPCVELLIADQQYNKNSFVYEQEILVYGAAKTSSREWVPPKEKEKEVPKKIGFHTISIWINHEDQIFNL